MAKCKECGVPLEGLLSFIPRLIGVKPSERVPGYCNKCEDMYLAKASQKSTITVKRKKKK